MSRENVEVVRRMYEAFHGGDAETALACYDPEVVVDASRRIDGATGHGHEGVAAIIGRWVSAWDDWHEEIEDIRASGAQVYVKATQRGRGKESGVETEYRYAVVYEVGGDKITGVTLYGDPAEALEAVGPRE